MKAFENRWPMFAPDEPGGASEVVLYSPEHDASLASLGAAHVRKVVDLWAERTEALLARPDVEYVLVFENRGADAGATIPHPHGQIYAFPFVPPTPAREAEVAERDGCPLCAEDPGARLVHENDTWRTWVPFASAYPYGLVLAARAHVDGIPALDDAQRDGLAEALVDALARLDRLFDTPFPYMLWIHHGFHVHVHVAPPRRAAETLRYVAAGEVGSGMLMNPVVPETAAQELRDA